MENIDQKHEINELVYLVTNKLSKGSHPSTIVSANSCIACLINFTTLIDLLCSGFQEHAFESSQKYKEGKYIIELAHMIKDNGWD